MGVVYTAEPERPVRRRIALKIIKLGLDTRQAIARPEPASWPGTRLRLSKPKPIAIGSPPSTNSNIGCNANRTIRFCGTGSLAPKPRWPNNLNKKAP